MKKDNLYTLKFKLQPFDGFASFNQWRASRKKEALAKAKAMCSTSCLEVDETTLKCRWTKKQKDEWNQYTTAILRSMD